MLHRLHHNAPSTQCANRPAPQSEALSSQKAATAVYKRRHVLSAAVLLLSGLHAAPAPALTCRGERGYGLQQCLRKARQEREAANDTAAAGDADAQRLQTRQFEQPGTLVTLPSGIQYREMAEGTGAEAMIGSRIELTYTVYRLSSGAYYKYSSGGTPVLLWALGHGFEGQDDIGSAYTCTLGTPGALPRAVEAGMMGMREGGRRRILVPPQLGWVTDKTGPIPPTFGGQRRLAAHRDEALLFEAELIKVRNGPASDQQQRQLGQQEAGQEDALPEQGTPYKLPAPPSPYKSLLG